MQLVYSTASADCNMLDCEILVNKLEFHLHYHIHFQIIQPIADRDKWVHTFPMNLSQLWITMEVPLV